MTTQPEAARPAPDTIARIVAETGRLVRARGIAAADAYLADTLQSHADTPAFFRDLAVALNESEAAEGDMAFRLLAAAVKGDPNDPDLLRRYVVAAWLRGQHDPADTRAIEGARHLVRLTPDNYDSYRVLGCAALSCGFHQEAFLAFSSVVAVAGSDLFAMTRRLAKFLMQGYRVASFEIDGQAYNFELSSFSTQAIEASSFHAAAQLTEIDELRFVRDFVDRCDEIVEIGALVGNHTVFFMKTLQPKRIRVFEANPRAVRQIEANAALNQDPNAPVRIEVVNTFVSAESRDDHAFAGNQVRSAPLEQMVRDRVDFVKIDVDGAEGDVLRGARSVLAAHRPKLMIEVNGATEAEVRAQVAELGYALVHEIQHPGYKNFFFDAKP